MRDIKFRAWDLAINRMLPPSSIWNIDLYSCEYKESLRLMQYTGLKDKSGKEIYEGDIVYIAGLGNCLVKWDDGGACWMFESKYEDAEYHFVVEDLESVVGNIYENPELLG